MRDLRSERKPYRLPRPFPVELPKGVQWRNRETKAATLYILRDWSSDRESICQEWLDIHGAAAPEHLSTQLAQEVAPFFREGWGDDPRDAATAFIGALMGCSLRRVDWHQVASVALAAAIGNDPRPDREEHAL